MDVQNLNIAVVGAGYAGAATARALINLGANVTVYEQASAVARSVPASACDPRRSPSSASSASSATSRR